MDTSVKLSHDLALRTLNEDDLPRGNGLLLDMLDAGQQDYTEIFHLQETLHHNRHQGLIPDVVMLLEHRPCITIGRSGGYHHLLANNVLLDQHGITVHETNRGGDITYHGPGQLVCYPILGLEGKRRDLHAYARNMEEVMIRTLDAFGITAIRKSEFPGVWVDDAKVGAMGIAVRKWVTLHGIALNVCPDLDHFSFIVPCGITSYGVTSMSEILGRKVDIFAVRDELRTQFSSVFHMHLQPAEQKQLVKGGK
jgi:lipoate-protein ligase B